MTISRKMMLGFAMIIMIMVISNGYVLLELHNVSQEGRTTLTSDVQTIHESKELKEILLDQERNGQKFLVSGDHVYFRLFSDDVGRFSISLDSLQSTPLSPVESGIVDQIRKEHISLAREFSKAEEKLLPRKEQKRLSSTLDNTASRIHAFLDKLILVNQKTIDQSMAEIEDTTRRSIRIALILVGSTLVLAIAASIVIASTITRPIKDLIRGTQEIARGSFTPIQVHSSDEMALLARAVNDLSTKLNALEALRTELMHHIAHELRTPLTTMLTAHYILSQQRVGRLNAEQLRLLHSIRKNIDKITAFSYDFLDLAKIEAGMMQYHFEPTDLVEFLQPLVEDARLTASGKRISLIFNASPAAAVLIDRQRFSHVVTNLLSNAIKYTNEDGRITVSLLPSDTGARIVVRDTGVGIPHEDLPKIFEKFYRVHAGDGKESVGTGVGLAIVKSITEAMGGSVHVASESGVGSTFTVELPAAPPNLDASQLPKKSATKEMGHG